jgi:hypothetical protein
MTKALCVILVIFSVRSVSMAQVVWGGQMSTDILKAARTTSPRTVNEGNPTFSWRADMLLDASINDQVDGFCTIRIEQNQYINFDALAILIRDVASTGLNVQAGKFDMPFGNLGERRFPRRNPLYSLPLIYEYGMSLPNYATTAYDLLKNRGMGIGMRLLDDGMYDVGLEVFGNAGIFGYAVAMSNGMISADSYETFNSNGDFGKIIRLTITPTTALTVGTSFAWGAYLETAGQYFSRTFDPSKYLQRVAEIDAEFSAGHTVINAEAVYSTYRVPLATEDVDLGVVGYYLEGKYTLFPRVYAAVRINGLSFADATINLVRQPWDFGVTEWEGGFGYFLDRDVLVKLIRRETRIAGGSKPKDNLTVAQLVVAF